MISQTAICPLPVSAAVAAAASVACDGWVRKCVFVSYGGGVTGTIQVQISPDGTVWFNEGAALTASGAVEVTKPCLFIRLNTTVIIAGGTATAILAGF